jgi:hypothetical protein
LADDAIEVNISRRDSTAFGAGAVVAFGCFIGRILEEAFFTEQTEHCLVVINYRAKPSGTEQNRAKPRKTEEQNRACSVFGPVPGFFWRPTANLTRANLMTSPTATSYEFQRRIAI